MLAVLIWTLLGLQLVTYSDQESPYTYKNGYVYFYQGGSCPEGKKPGDVYYKPYCKQVECHPGYYYTKSCGPTNPVGSECYARFNFSLNFPGCCKPIVFCAGDKGFDRKQLD